MTTREVTKQQLKEWIVRSYQNTHLENIGYSELVRVAKMQNGTIMARYGWSFDLEEVTELVREILKEELVRV